LRFQLSKQVFNARSFVVVVFWRLNEKKMRVYLVVPS